MAIKLTEEILGIQTTSTIYKEHLYELAGFKPLFPEELLNALISGTARPEGQLVNLPIVNVGLSDKPAFSGLCELQPAHMEAVPGGVKIVFRRKDGLVEFHAFLNFRDERLEFEIGQDLKVFDDGSADAMELAASVIEFQKGYFLNGRLRIDNAETGQLIARKDAFIPMNVFVNPEGFEAQIARCRNEAEVRRTFGQRVWRAQVSSADVSYSFKPASSATATQTDTGATPGT